MKKLISVAAFLAASSALSNAGTVVFDDFFGTAETSSAATFMNDIFHDYWQPASEKDIFSPSATSFLPVYNFGLKPGAAATGNAGTLYYDNANGSDLYDAGNRPSITVGSDGSATINTYVASQGITFTTYWNTLSAETLESVSDLSISFTGGIGCETLQFAVFYLETGGNASNVQRLLLEDSFVEGTAYSYSLTDITTGKNATGGTLVLAVLNTYDSIWKTGKLSNIVISGTAIPEPSAFGLLAGAGALALVAARRRRSRKA